MTKCTFLFAKLNELNIATEISLCTHNLQIHHVLRINKLLNKSPNIYFLYSYNMVV